MSRTRPSFFSGRWTLGAVLALSSLPLACSSGSRDESQAPQDASQTEVLVEVEAMYADLSARDWNALAEHFWTGATITTTFAPSGESAARVVVIPVPEFIATGPEGPGSKEIFEERMADAQVLRYENVAVVWSSFEAKFGDPGEVVEWSGIDAITLMQHEGRWKIVSISFASDR